MQLVKLGSKWLSRTWKSALRAATAATHPSIGVNSRNVQSDAFPSGRDSNRAGSLAKNVTSTRSRELQIPSPVAFSNASLRVHRLKNAAGLSSAVKAAK